MSDLARALAAAMELKRREDRRRLYRYVPYPFQQAFHEAGAENDQVVLMAANRVGKTRCGAAETAFHLTGLYPDVWTGRRFHNPIKAWVAGATNPKTRDVLQRELCGEPADPDGQGTGMVPGELITSTTRRRTPT